MVAIRLGSAALAVGCALVAGSALADCKCPAPRLEKATALSGVLKLAYEEKFEALRRRGTERVDVVFNLPYTGMTGAVNEVTRRIEQSMRQRAKKDGFTGVLNFDRVSTNVNNLTRDGFEFLHSEPAKDEKGRAINVGVYRRVTRTPDQSEPGRFEAHVWLRARVCVERGEASLTFDPEIRYPDKAMTWSLPAGANIPRERLEAQFDQFVRKVKAEAGQLERRLEQTRFPLSDTDQRRIQQHSVARFDVKVPVRFFDRNEALDVRISPLVKARMCGAH